MILCSTGNGGAKGRRDLNRREVRCLEGRKSSRLASVGRSCGQGQSQHPHQFESTTQYLLRSRWRLVQAEAEVARVSARRKTHVCRCGCNRTEVGAVGKSVPGVCVVVNSHRRVESQTGLSTS